MAIFYGKKIITDHGSVCIQQTDDYGYILGGFTTTNGGDYWITKIDSIGDIEWQKNIGGSGLDEINSIRQTVEGGYIAGGTSNSNISGDKTENCRGHFDYWIVKLGSTGNIQWQKTLGGSNYDRLYSIGQSSDGSFFGGGYSDSDLSGDKTENSKGFEDYWIVKLDNSGNLLWQKTIGGNGDDALLSMQVTKDDEYILAGVSLSGISGDKTENNVGSSDFWVIKTTIDTYISENNLFDQVMVYPNPASSYLNIGFIPAGKYQVLIKNILGITLAEFKNDASRLQIDIRDFPDGIYYFILSDNAKNRFVKMFIKSGY